MIVSMLDHRLESGDTVEIITAKADNGPSQGWLDFVASQRAKFARSRRGSSIRADEAVDIGKGETAKAIRRRNQPLQRLMSHDTLRAVAQDLSREGVTELYAAIGEGAISAETVVRRLIMSQGGEAGVEETLAEAVTPTRIQHRRSDGK